MCKSGILSDQIDKGQTLNLALYGKRPLIGTCDSFTKIISYWGDILDTFVSCGRRIVGEISRYRIT